MLAVLKEEPKPNHIVVKEIEAPKKLPGHILAQVHAVGICGSDLHYYHWTKDYQRRLSGCLPVILGHEFSGVIEKVGDGVEGFVVGDKIVARPGFSCNHCYCCMAGNDGICQNIKTMGVDLNGAMAEYVSVPADSCFKLPEDYSMLQAAITEPITIAYNAVLKAGSLLGKDVVIFGPGPLGYFISLFAQANGARTQTVIGLPEDATRMQIFRNSIRAIELVDDVEDLFKTVDKKTGNRGADVAFEVTGSATGFQQSLEIVRKSGTVVLVGIISDTVSIDTNLAVRKEITVRGTHAAARRVWEETIRIMQSLPVEEKEKFEQSITHRFPLEKAKQAFKTAETGMGMKVLLLP